jgi:hypothetical protein
MMATPTSLHDLRNSSGLRHGGVAGDRIEFVERAAGVAQAAARDHRHEAAAGRDHRAEHQRDDVADAAGRVLVDHGAGQVQRFPFQDLAGIAHGQGEGDAFVHIHVVEIDRHRQRGDLAFGDVTVGDAAHEELDLVGSQGAAVALLADDFLGEEHILLKCFQKPSRAGG